MVWNYNKTLHQSVSPISNQEGGELVDLNQNYTFKRLCLKIQTIAFQTHNKGKNTSIDKQNLKIKRRKLERSNAEIYPGSA